ncbi:hypothetical protein ZIOFF_014886 [Zingiber officinale]|uniref:HECT-type E3 ubiquitin transferase n=2 Tax=Zingiber officinale TaxID=94328 RepID=A0A8J5LVW3_ZINOF|nr:hypothetical protein ZIOFF_014886 [Zingiber officinale]
MARVSAVEWLRGGSGRCCCSFKRITFVICCVNLVVALLVIHSFYTSFFFCPSSGLNRNYLTDQTKKMEESIRIRREMGPLALVNAARMLRMKLSREEKKGCIQLSQLVMHKLASEILQMLRGVDNTNWLSTAGTLKLQQKEKKITLALNQLSFCNSEENDVGPQNGAQYGAPFVEEEWEEQEIANGVVLMPDTEDDDDAVDAHDQEYLEFNDLLQETSSAQYILQQYIAASGGFKLLSSIRNTYSMGKVRMVAIEFETATRITKNRNPTRDAESGGFVTDYELILGGRNIRVTEETKYEYVDLVAEHILTTAIRPQINSFLEGFNELVPKELISIFNDKELELLLSGLPEIDLDDFQANTEYTGYSAASTVIQWFWEVVKSFNKEDMASLLQFVTGTSKVPLEGFKALQGISGPQQFQTHKTYGAPKKLPSAHTCFNQLDLPEYSSREQLEERLLLAIHEASEGFGFG